MRKDDLMTTGERLLELTKRAGASGASVSLSFSKEKSVSIRDGKLDDTSNCDECGFSVTAIVGEKRGYASSASFDRADLEASAKAAVAMAKAVTGNKYLRLATPEEWPCTMDELGSRLALLDRFDPAPPPTLAELKESATLLDSLAVSYPGVSRSEGSAFSFDHSLSASLNTNGFHAIAESTIYSKSTSVISVRDGEMVSAHHSHSSRYKDDLRQNEECVRRAAKHAKEKLGASTLKTAKMPVIFDRRISSSLLSALLSGINGDAIYKGSSFLRQLLHKQIFRDGVNIAEEPHIPRRLGSKLYDGEKVRTSAWKLVDNGTLTMWLTSIESGAKLGLPSTGHASGTSNLRLSSGLLTQEDLLGKIDRGLLVTGLMGRGLNVATGDYSVGAEGLLIENGKIVRPVNKVTIAGNMLDMFQELIPANDYSDNSQGAIAPSCFVGQMMVAGN